jgi:hypothetical protein
MGGAPTVPLPEVVAAPIPSAVESLPSPIAPTEAAKPIKKRITKTAPKALEPTPIETVVGLLQHKDTLVAAFLLREIFDPPVSRR